MSNVVAVLRRDERGMTTAEYAVGTVATCGAATLLLKLITSDFFQNLLRQIFERAFTSVL